jgi:uncharacterized protein (TIGR03435 family)
MTHDRACDNGRGFRVLLILCFVSSVAMLSAQAPVSSNPRFAVVSIRALSPDAPPTIFPQDFSPVLPGGRFRTPHTTVISLIAFAYGVRNPDARLLGLPAWRTTRYAVAAAAGDDFPALAPEQNLEQVRLMVREMLADRFRLRLHEETRQQTVLRMSVGKGGLRLKEVPAPVPPEQEGRVNLALGDDGGRMIASKATMAALARSFGVLARQEVLDETGLKGYYDFDLRWSAPPVPNEPPPGGRLGPAGIALFMTTLKDEFGLQFSSATGPVQYWNVDRIEPPATEN